MQLVVLAGGFGTRLKSVLNGLPKPLADINGQPFLKLQFINWIKMGFNDFILCLHYESDKIIEFIKNEQIHGILKNCKIQFSVEPRPLGTAGAISYASNKILLENQVLITNADTWLNFEIKDLLESSDNTIVVVEVENVDRYGSVKLGSGNQIENFVEKGESIGLGYINAGFYKISKTFFENQIIEEFSIEKNIFPMLVREQKLNFILSKNNFIDIGIPDDYYKFCKWFKVY